METLVNEKPTVTQVDDRALRTAPINASGHVQQLDRVFGFFSSCSISIVVDNAWVAGGGALVSIAVVLSTHTR